MKVSSKNLSKIDPVIIKKLQLHLFELSHKSVANSDHNDNSRSMLGWIDLPIKSRNLLPEIDALCAWARSRKLTDIFLCGTGGSSLAAEVLATNYEKKLIIMDSTDPVQVLKSMPEDFTEALVIIATKSGTTIETISLFKYFQSEFRKRMIEPNDHIVIITDPGTPLDDLARSDGYKVFHGDLNVGGRFSALSAFGLVPAALVGIDVSVLLDDAEKMGNLLQSNDSPAVLIAAALFLETDLIVNLCAVNEKTLSLSRWIEQLIAESTGKDATGRLPINIESIENVISGISVGFKPGNYDLIIEGSLGEQFILWEFAVVLLSNLLGVDPFDQPNVLEVKDRTLENLKYLTKKDIQPYESNYEDEDLIIYTNNGIDNLSNFLKIASRYFAVLAFLAPDNEDEILVIQKLIAHKSKRPTSFGWGPQYLHSTGQFHKGGQQDGAFILISGHSDSDVQIPGENYTFSNLINAQILADTHALTGRNLPFIRIHLKNRKLGIKKLISELEKN